MISGRISRLNSVGAETVLVEDYCQQYPSHSVGALEFDSAGNLWASGGDGASFTFADFGQDGNPVNPCADPLNEGGALRSQDLRTHPVGGDPVTLDGTLIRINPSTGAGVATNPLAGDSNANARRVVAYGVRNPFRFTISPDNEIYTGDVGWSTWEEINRFPVGTGTLQNFGWPCYEGNNSGVSANQPGYDAPQPVYLRDPLRRPRREPCRRRSSPTTTGRRWGRTASPGTSSIAGLAFNTANTFPVGYDGALFFADYSRDCIWTMTTGPDGKPDPTTVTPFQDAASNPVNLTFGPGGALYYPNFDNGQVRRIAFTGTPAAPYVTSQGGVVTYHGSNGVEQRRRHRARRRRTGSTRPGSAPAARRARTAALSSPARRQRPTSVVMNMGGGNDTATASAVTEDPFTIRGQAGNDTLTATGADDTLNGGAGNDRLDGAGQHGRRRRAVRRRRHRPSPLRQLRNGGHRDHRHLRGQRRQRRMHRRQRRPAQRRRVPGRRVVHRHRLRRHDHGQLRRQHVRRQRRYDRPPAIDGDDTFNGDPAGCLAATTDGTEADFMGGGEGADIFNGDGSAATPASTPSPTAPRTPATRSPGRRAS